MMLWITVVLRNNDGSDSSSRKSSLFEMLMILQGKLADSLKVHSPDSTPVVYLVSKSNEMMIFFNRVTISLIDL